MHRLHGASSPENVLCRQLGLVRPKFTLADSQAWPAQPGTRYATPSPASALHAARSSRAAPIHRSLM